MSTYALTVLASLGAVALLVAYDFWWRFGTRFEGTGFMEPLRGQVFLTYDDGPASEDAGWSNRMGDARNVAHAILAIDPGWRFDASPTENLRRTLDEFGAHAVFFVRGDVLEADPSAREMVRRLVAEGHVVGNHSLSHHRAHEMTPAAAVAEVERADRIISEATAAPVELFRAPYGLWHVGLTWRMRYRRALRGYGLPVGWTHSTRDWARQAADLDLASLESAADELVASFRASRTAIVLLQHDVWIYGVLLTRVLLRRLAQEPTLRVGSPFALVEHVRDATGRAGPACAAFYLRARAGLLWRRLGGPRELGA